MKTIKILLIAVLFIGAYSASAQTEWTTNGSNIYKTTTGNVGIGITTPLQDLNIVDATGAANVQLERNYTGTTGINGIGSYLVKNSGTGDIAYFGLRKNTTSSDFVMSVYDGTAAAWRQFIYFHLGTRKYEVQNGVADVEYKNTGNFILNNNGSVGIGTGTTTIPSTAKLAVNGKILATEVQVALVANWADYVFNEDYNLRPLSEVESFIKENKHLPDVPSTEEVANNGVNLGEMNAVLLQKVEELTLYVIQLQKEVESLKSK
jgi:hypothetical protein